MKFSVLITVYAKDDPSYFKTALHSIWDNQSLRPDQLVIVKDGPLPDNLNRLVRAWKKEATILNLSVNQGLAKALNFGLSLCRHELVARMDADDVSMPERFSCQNTRVRK